MNELIRPIATTIEEAGELGRTTTERMTGVAVSVERLGKELGEVERDGARSEQEGRELERLVHSLKTG
ncbi:MAG: hypothetical protein ACOYM2_20785 [Rectinemataceae bacterium]